MDIITLKNISKTFGLTQVLYDLNFSIKKGEVHALVGENGAGKSTLLNILHGVYQEYDGEIFVEGKKVEFSSTFDATKLGIVKVHQEINLINELTVGQNIVLGYEPMKKGIIDYNSMFDTTDKILKRLGCRFDSRTIVKNLTAGEMQMIAIAKALYFDAKVISFDEPTAALSKNETIQFFKIVNELKEAGITIIYVSHRLEEIFNLADRATVLLDGHLVDTFDVEKLTKEKLIQSMVGRDVAMFAQRQKPRRFTDEVVLEVVEFTQGDIFKDISFKLKKGEILGFYGLVGSKRTDMVNAIFGAGPKTTGHIYINGKEKKIKSPTHGLKAGIALVPEERKSQGFVTTYTNAENITLPNLMKYTKNGVINHTNRLAAADSFVEKLKVNPRRGDMLTASLSGGNQQKVVIAKWLHQESSILILDEPTKGIDVGSKEEIYSLLEELVENGKSIIVVSSELTEVMGLCDRLYVMKDGRLMKEFDHNHYDESKILEYALGGNR